MTVWEMGELPFYDIFPNAERDFHDFDSGGQWIYLHLPYQEDYGYLMLSPPSKLLWKCRWCNFWCEMLDQRIMEEHLIIRCGGIEKEVRRQYKKKVFSQIFHSLEALDYNSSRFDTFDIPVRSVSP
jgi:hypothetical protein